MRFEEIFVIQIFQAVCLLKLELFVFVDLMVRMLDSSRTNKIMPKMTRI